jgi:hypothetical protein
MVAVVVTSHYVGIDVLHYSEINPISTPARAAGNLGRLCIPDWESALF